MTEREKYLRNIDNHYSDLSKEIKDRMDHVWDYIIYREITDKKVEELEKKNRDLRRDLDDMEYENSRLNRELNKYKKKKFFNQLSGNKRKANDAFNVTNYCQLSIVVDSINSLLTISNLDGLGYLFKKSELGLRSEEFQGALQRFIFF